MVLDANCSIEAQQVDRKVEFLLPLILPTELQVDRLGKVASQPHLWNPIKALYAAQDGDLQGG